MNELINVAFALADAAHRQHLASETLSEHAALGEFYADVRAAADTFAEAAMGMDVEPPGGANIVTELEGGLIDLVDMRDRVCQDNSILLNLFDELTGVYARALFKLKRLN